MVTFDLNARSARAYYFDRPFFPDDEGTNERSLFPISHDGPNSIIRHIPLRVISKLPSL